MLSKPVQKGGALSCGPKSRGGEGKNLARRHATFGQRLAQMAPFQKVRDRDHGCHQRAFTRQRCLERDVEMGITPRWAPRNKVGRGMVQPALQLARSALGFKEVDTPQVDMPGASRPQQLRCHHEAQGIGHDPSGLGVGRQRRTLTDGDIIGEGGKLIARMGLRHVDRHTGMRRGKGPQSRDQPAHRKGRRRGDPQCSPRRCGADLGDRLREQVTGLVDRAGQSVGLGQGKRRTADPVEQRYAQPGLDLRHLLAHGTGRHMKLMRRGCEALVTDHGSDDRQALEGREFSGTLFHLFSTP